MKVSIITAVLNNKEHIEGCIKSVRAQAYGDIEHIIVDSGSTDGTKEILNNYPDGMSRILHEGRIGVYYALNRGISQATGDIIGILHSDDMYGDCNVIKDVAEAFAIKEVDAVYGDLVYVRRDNPGKVVRYWRPGEFKYANLKKGWAPAHPALFLRKSVYDKSGLFNTSFSIAADYDFMLRALAQRELKAFYLSRVLVKMRLGGLSNKNLSCFCRKTYEDYLVLKGNSIPFPFYTLIAKIYRKHRQFFIR